MKSGAVAIATPRSRLADFVALTKPRVNSLVVVTTGVGYLAGRIEGFDAAVFAHTTIGSALVAGGAAALNQIAERDLDGRMTRTRDRPLPAGRLHLTEATWFAVLLAVAGLGQLAFGANLTAAVVALATLVSYAGIYTPFKRRSHWAVLVGAVPGALPVVIGWAAAAPLSADAWALFALVFVWQLPHFLALTWLYRVDFARAGLPLLSVSDPSGRRTARHLLVYTVLLLPVSLTPKWLGLAGLGYAVGATMLTTGLLVLATRFAADRSTERARVLFRATLPYLPLVWGLLLVDAAGFAEADAIFDTTTLPAVNATLNSIAALLLASGYVLIRRGRIAQHRLCMLAAFATSTLFLVSYLVYHAQVGSRPFTGQGPIRYFYFTVLISHVSLAALILPLALVTLRRGLRRDDARHVAVARWTLPIWLYVSVTGVVVYWMLYQM